MQNSRNGINYSATVQDSIQEDCKKTQSWFTVDSLRLITGRTILLTIITSMGIIIYKQLIKENKMDHLLTYIHEVAIRFNMVVNWVGFIVGFATLIIGVAVLAWMADEPLNDSDNGRLLKKAFKWCVIIDLICVVLWIIRPV